MLTTILLTVIALLLFAVWRLKGDRTVKEAVKVVIQGGGGPGPRPEPDPDDGP